MDNIEQDYIGKHQFVGEDGVLQLYPDDPREANYILMAEFEELGYRGVSCDRWFDEGLSTYVPDEETDFGVSSFGDEDEAQNLVCEAGYPVVDTGIGCGTHDHVVENVENGRSYAEHLAVVRGGPECEAVFGALGPIARAVGEAGKVFDWEAVDPFPDGGCWRLLFRKQDQQLFDDAKIPVVLSLSAVCLVTYMAGLNDEDLFVYQTGNERQFHIRRPANAMEKCKSTKANEWLKAFVEEAGLFKDGRDVVFGGKYQNWQTEGEVGRVSRSTWLDITALANLIKESFSSPFSKQSHREVIVRLIQECEVRGIVGYENRFPARGTYVSMATSDWGETLADLMSSASYRDRSKDDRAKHNVDEPGNVREETYNDALTGYAKTLRKIWQNIADAPGAYTRESFEDNFKTVWLATKGETDDSVSSVWEDYKGKAGCYAALPWFTSQAVDAMISQLHRKNPTVNADLASISSVVANAMSLASPFSKVKPYVGGYHVSACSGDWADKFIRLFLCAGHQDGTKDEKFKRGQILPSTLQFDKSDMVRQFYTTLTDINRQYAEHAHFVTSESVLMRMLNLHKKIPPTDAEKVIAKIKAIGDWRDDKFMDWEVNPSKYGKKIPTGGKPSTLPVTRLSKSDEVFLPFYYYSKNTDGTYGAEKEIKLTLLQDDDDDEQQSGVEVEFEENEFN